ncbi:MAG: nitrogenase iron-molybdenum cofactor biosynthesis protein NifE [Magnetococcales bacterium]|nr:nitrogenase iron-molybdenum cofactor biosynthesis protein NifE [Magnetococcales bacterium]
MTPAEISNLLQESACEHNSPQGGGEKVGCGRLKPGATAGGCSFDGAMITLFPIGDVAHIVHGSSACAGSSWDSRGSISSGASLYRLGMTTDMTEQDIIMGRGEKRLLHGIKQVVNRYHPKAVFVYQTCIPAMIGDNIEAICQAAQDHFHLPVIPVDCAGFYGTKNLGNRIAGETMVRRVIGHREPPPIPENARRPGMIVHDINLVGEFNIAGEFWHVLPLLDALGLRVLCTLAGNARFQEVQTMHRGEVTMLVCSKALINVARLLQEQYAIPWFEGSFYGIRATTNALRSLARIIDDPDLVRRTEALIQREETAIQKKIEPLAARLRGRRALLYTGGVKSWSIVSALQDLGMVVVATGTRKSTEQDKVRIRALMGEEAIMIDEGKPEVLLKIAREQGAEILIAGGRNMFTALKGRLPFLDINQEREHAYAGYQGMVTLAEQLLATLESPIWPWVRNPPPWSFSGESKPWPG